MGEGFGFGREVLFSECGYRARLVRGARNDMRGIALKCDVVGNDPCVVPCRVNVTY